MSFDFVMSDVRSAHRGSLRVPPHGAKHEAGQRHGASDFHPLPLSSVCVTP